VGDVFLRIAFENLKVLLFEPRTKRLALSVTVTGTTTRLVSTRMLMVWSAFESRSEAPPEVWAAANRVSEKAAKTKLATDDPRFTVASLARTSPDLWDLARSRMQASGITLIWA